MQGLERMEGIEPSPKAWEAFVLPLNYTRIRIFSAEQLIRNPFSSRYCYAGGFSIGNSRSCNSQHSDIHGNYTQIGIGMPNCSGHNDRVQVPEPEEMDHV